MRNKPEQKEAIKSLLDENDAFALLPTSFGKSPIYQSFVSGKEIIHEHSPTVIVVIPLRSIVQASLEAAWKRLVNVSDERAKRQILVNTARFELSV